ncbi:hypothetical protein K3495_g3082 [Podosphaera aphanis]|nr:hypothetical protein K3495_g3082 [Podosphaera aphanis]
MAPLPVSPPSDHDVIEKQMKDIIQDLFQIIVQVNAFDLVGRPGKDVLEASVTQLSDSLSKVNRTVSGANLTPNASGIENVTKVRSIQLPHVPPELIQYVDNGRNPDIYTREFVELARKSNQLMKGKMEAFADFRDVLAREMQKALPELDSEINLVLERTSSEPR